MQRRWIVLLSLLTLALGAAVAQEDRSAAPLKVRQLNEDLYVIEGTSNGQSDVPNLLIYVTGDGVVLVDPWFAKDYDRILSAVKTVTDQPVRYVINTHFHSDHSGSNGRYPRAYPHIA